MSFHCTHIVLAAAWLCLEGSATVRADDVQAVKAFQLDGLDRVADVIPFDASLGLAVVTRPALNVWSLLVHHWPESVALAGSITVTALAPLPASASFTMSAGWTLCAASACTPDARSLTMSDAIHWWSVDGAQLARVTGLRRYVQSAIRPVHECVAIDLRARRVVRTLVTAVSPITADAASMSRDRRACLVRIYGAEMRFLDAETGDTLGYLAPSRVRDCMGQPVSYGSVRVAGIGPDCRLAYLSFDDPKTRTTTLLEWNVEADILRPIYTSSAWVHGRRRLMRLANDRILELSQWPGIYETIDVTLRSANASPIVSWNMMAMGEPMRTCSDDSLITLSPQVPLLTEYNDPVSVTVVRWNLLEGTCTTELEVPVQVNPRGEHVLACDDHFNVFVSALEGGMPAIRWGNVAQRRWKGRIDFPQKIVLASIAVSPDGAVLCANARMTVNEPGRQWVNKLWVFTLPRETTPDANRESNGIVKIVAVP